MKKLLFALTVMAALLIAGCSPLSVNDIKDNPEEFVGKEISLKGTAINSIKLGKLSGFTLEQEGGASIPISSQSLPQDGTKVKVTGVVVQDTLFGMYILANDVN